MHLAHVELHVLEIGIRSLAVLTQLVPTSRDAAIIIEQYQLPRVPVRARDLTNVRVANAVQDLVECSQHCFGPGRLGRSSLRRRLNCLRRRSFGLGRRSSLWLWCSVGV